MKIGRVNFHRLQLFVMCRIACEDLILRGYYLWDWFNTRTIKYDKDINFHCDNYAKTQGAFKRFKDCKAHGVAQLEILLSGIKEDLAALKDCEIKDT